MSSDHSPDHLSSSPSFVNILSFIHYQDICSIRLVSRRCHLIVRSHTRALPRPRINLTMKITEYEDWGNIHYLLLTACEPMKDVNKEMSSTLLGEMKRTPLQSMIFLRDDRAQLIDCPHFITDAMATIGTFLCKKPYAEATTDDSLLRRMRLGHAMWNYEKCHVYRISGIEEGLTAFLSPLLARYYVEDMQIIRIACKMDSRREQWLELLAHVFRKSMSRCRWIRCGVIWQGMDRFCKGIRSVAFSFCVPETFSTFLPKIECFDQEILAFVVKEYFTEPDAIVQLVKRWEEGVMRIRLFRVVMVECRMQFEYSQLASALDSPSRRLYMRKWEGEDPVNYPIYRLSLRRASDNASIHIYYTPKSIVLQEFS